MKIKTPLCQQTLIATQKQKNTCMQHFFVEVPEEADLCDEPNNTVFNCHSIHPEEWRILTRFSSPEDQGRISIKDPALPALLHTILNDPIVMLARGTGNRAIRNDDKTEK